MTHYSYLKIKFHFYYHLNSRGLICRAVYRAWGDTRRTVVKFYTDQVRIQIRTRMYQFRLCWGWFSCIQLPNLKQKWVFFSNKETLFVDEDYLYNTVFIRKAPIRENTSSECIRIVAAMCSCKILQLYEYEANECGHEPNCERYPKNTSSCSKTKDVFIMHGQNSTCSKIKIITINILL